MAKEHFLGRFVMLQWLMNLARPALRPMPIGMREAKLDDKHLGTERA
jgi:hypothetical protein